MEIKTYRNGKGPSLEQDERVLVRTGLESKEV
jgi:hypothetical protein